MIREYKGDDFTRLNYGRLSSIGSSICISYIHINRRQVFAQYLFERVRLQ